MTIRELEVVFSIEAGSLVVRVTATNDDWSMASDSAFLPLDDLAKALAERALAAKGVE